MKSQQPGHSETKATSIAIFSVTNGEGSGFSPSWMGGSGTQLTDCPFSFDEERNSPGEQTRSLLRPFEERESFSGACLEGADFSDEVLANADFSYANMRMSSCVNSDFTMADFRFADLTFAELDFSDFVKADLRGVDLCKASLRGANLRGANLSGADLEHADFLEADLCGAILVDVDVRNARFAGALFDSQTVLPFSYEDAQILGMIQSPILGRAQ